LVKAKASILPSLGKKRKFFFFLFFLLFLFLLYMFYDFRLIYNYI
jgi:hypothetical protein